MDALSPLYPQNLKNFPLFPQSLKIPQFSVDLLFFSLISVFFRPTYFDHDAFTHHAIHAQDAPVCHNS